MSLKDMKKLVWLNLLDSFDYEGILDNFIKKGNLKAVKYFCKKVNNVNLTFISTAAFKCGRLEIVQYCVQRGWRPRSTFSVKVKPNPQYLKIGEKIGYKAFAVLFLNLPSIYDSNLHLKRWCRDNLKYGDAFDLSYAIRQGYKHIIEWVIDTHMPSDSELEDYTALAYTSCNLEIFKLLSKHVDFDADSRAARANYMLDFSMSFTPQIWHFIRAISDGMIRELEECFKHECPLTHPMEIAVEANCGKSIKFLMNKGYECKNAHPAIVYSQLVANKHVENQHAPSTN